MQAFVSVNKGNLLPPLLLSRLNPITCHRSSPMRLFPSYQQRWLPISLNCLLCKVAAEEYRWERPVLSFSCGSLTVSSPKEGLYLRTILNTFGKLHCRVDLEWNFCNRCWSLQCEEEKSPKCSWVTFNCERRTNQFRKMVLKDIEDLTVTQGYAHEYEMLWQLLNKLLDRRN